MNEIEKYSSETFDNIRKLDNNGNEYWEARELQKILGYSQWRNTINRAKKACENSKLMCCTILPTSAKWCLVVNSRKMFFEKEVNRWENYKFWIMK